jgi:hypothetical protein
MGPPGEAELTAALGALAQPAPDPAFRERLRREFVSGRLSAPPTRSRRRPLGRAWPAWVLAPAVVAAALILAVVMNQGPAWVPIGIQGSGVAIDGRFYPARAGAQIARHLHPGASISVPEDAELVMISAHVLVIDAAPGTKMNLPRAPGRWFGRTSTCRLDEGEARVLTGPDFAGSRFRMWTHEGVTQLTGTAVSVFRAEPLTCVCVLEGTAEVGLSLDTLEKVPAGMRKMMQDGVAEIVPIVPEHEEGLLEFVHKYRSAVGRPAH